MASPFRVSYSADFFDEEQKPRFGDYGQKLLDAEPGVEVDRLGDHRAEVSPDQLEGIHGLIALSPRITASSLSNSEDFLAVSRFGVGYDSVDVPACTQADVLLTITSGAVDRPVAEATVGWMIALSHRMLAKDRLLREGKWDDRTRYTGTELRDRTLGVIGFGGIGRALVQLLASFGMQKPLVFDPYLDNVTADSLGTHKVELQELMLRSDFVSVHCPLNTETRGLVGATELEWMKPTAYFINTARGGIVDEEALFEVLSAGRIAGAAIDCFEGEPITAPHRFGTLNNVLLAPHSICWTHELFRDIGRTASNQLIDLAYGRRPHGVVNPELFDRLSFQKKWKRMMKTADER